MSRWQAAIVGTADALGEALACEQVGVDLDVALTGRAVALELVTTVLGDLAPHTRIRQAGAFGPQVPVGAIETDPLAALARVILGRTRLATERAPSELLDANRVLDPATAAWVEVGRRALGAEWAWTGPGEAPLSREQAWQAVGEVANLAQAVAVLDRQLAQQAAGRADVLAVLSSTGGLHIAAREVVTFAASPASDLPVVHSTRDGAAIGAALAARAGRESTLERDVRRLTALFAETHDLMPRHVRAGAEVGRDLSVLAAREATGPSGASVLNELGALARALHATTHSNRGEFSVQPIRHRVLELQLQDLHASARLALATRQQLGPDAATRLARRLPNLVDTLAGRAKAQVTNGLWAMPDRGETSVLAYTFASTINPDRTPLILDRLAEASAAAGILRDAVAPPAPLSPLAASLARLPAHRDPRRLSHPAAVAAPISRNPIPPGR